MNTNEITVLTFGSISEITRTRSLVMKNIFSTDLLVHQLEEQFPGLKTVQYAIAVNMQLVHEHVGLNDGATVALLPPFSGG